MCTGEHKTTPFVHIKLHAEGSILLKRKQVMVFIHDFRARGGLDHTSSDQTGLLDVEL